MLLHSGGYVQPSCYYPDPSYLPHHATPPPPHFDKDTFLSHPTAYQGHIPATACPQPQLHTYYPQEASGGFFQPRTHNTPYFCSCGCPWKPVQETFLHKILTGKGYKNDAMCVSSHGHLLMAGRSVDPGHFSVNQSAGRGLAMAASCCYSGMSSRAVATAVFPPSVPGL